MRKVKLRQEGETVILVIQTEARGYRCDMTPEQANKLAYRLMAFASSGHNSQEIVFEEENNK